MEHTAAAARSSESPRKAWGNTWWAWLLALLLSIGPRLLHAVEYRPLPPAPPVGLSNDWLIYDAAGNKLVLYLPGYHPPARAYYQWVAVRPNQPFRISFAARQDLALFVDNQLIFRAESAGNYTLDLTQLLPKPISYGQHLLCVWHPAAAPDYVSFSSALPAEAKTSSFATANWWKPQLRASVHQGENVFLCFLILIGLMYGAIRTVYRPGFARIYELWSNVPGEQNFLTRPTITWLNVLLILLFSLSFGLLIVAIHTNVQNIVILKQLFSVSESGLVVRVILYAVLVSVFVFAKAVYIALMGYIFDLSSLVLVQYREFVRSLLFMGLFLPIVMLLYLVLNQSWPEGVLWVSNGVVSTMLLATVFRVGRTLNRRMSLLNLHLFSYLCATEIIPLTVLLKLLVITY
ncbi:DUF4271 domain-containing protein [Hymenobacter oligotrophus]|uniref:DUF4271 domain-containing protein n=1 Tax=Hymenobacter oligotrophus TaxID=2319843 RepID=A0A3B7R2G3_9BACT|nr:DUF4271 domain-containing protein [Hymenobacter oligotrophus]AYA38205.1 DUF4271 domain-containing protein [Hymenobacter oligotrophus]